MAWVKINFKSKKFTKKTFQDCDWILQDLGFEPTFYDHFMNFGIFSAAFKKLLAILNYEINSEYLNLNLLIKTGIFMLKSIKKQNNKYFPAIMSLLIIFHPPNHPSRALNTTKCSRKRANCFPANNFDFFLWKLFSPPTQRRRKKYNSG